MPVVTATVEQQDVPVDIPAIGNVEAYSTISVRSQITAQLLDVRFHEGDIVRKGELLFALDRRTLEAQLAQAEANLKRDEALLSQAEAQLGRDAAFAEFSQLSAERQGVLTQRGIVSKDQLDQARSQADATAAAVKADRASIESARAQLVAQQAAVDKREWRSSYTIIRSPLDGRTGNLNLKPGNLVTANSTELMTIAQIQPAYVTFSVPAAHLAAIKAHMAGEPLSVSATAQEQGAQPATGRLAFVDNTVDASTDTIKLKGRFDNDDRQLWPGQFARVSLRLATLRQATVVPERSRPDGPGRSVRLRREARFDRRAATGRHRAARERGRRDRKGAEAGGDDRHRRAAAARTWNDGDDRSRGRSRGRRSCPRPRTWRSGSGTGPTRIAMT